MPIIKSAIKRARQQTKRHKHNLVVKTAVKKDIRAALDAIAAGDAKTITLKLSEAASELDRAVKKGTLHKNTAARRKSRLAKLANKTLAGPKPKVATKKPAAKKAAAKKPAAKTAKK